MSVSSLLLKPGDVFLAGPFLGGGYPCSLAAFHSRTPSGSDLPALIANGHPVAKQEDLVPKVMGFIREQPSATCGKNWPTARNWPQLWPR